MSDRFRWLLPLALLAALCAGCMDDASKDEGKDDKNAKSGEDKTSDKKKDDDSSMSDKLFGKKKDDATLAKIHNANGMAASAKGDFSTASREFAKAIELDDKPEYYNNLGRCYFWIARYNDALAAFNKAEALGMKKEDTIELYANIADVYRMQGNVRKAADYYQKAIALNTNYLRAHYELGHMYLLIGNYKSAEDRLNFVIKTDPGNNKALLDRLILYRQTNRFELAYNDMVTLDRRSFDINDSLRDQILDGVKKQKEAEAAGR